MIDAELKKYAEEHRKNLESDTKVLYMWDADSGMIDKWHKYCQKQMRDNFHMLDEKLIFSNAKTNKKDYASKKLSYPLEKGDISAYNKLMSTLYSEEERHKIEWAIGSIVSGDSKKIQKFMFVPDWSLLTGKTFLMALGMAFFSLSVGVASMMTYASYLDKKVNLVSSAMNVAWLNIGISILAGLVIFPAVFSLGFEPSSGPGLIFIILPAVFQQIPLGSFWMIIFFII